MEPKSASITSVIFFLLFIYFFIIFLLQLLTVAQKGCLKNILVGGLLKLQEYFIQRLLHCLFYYFVFFILLFCVLCCQNLLLKLHKDVLVQMNSNPTAMSSSG